MRFFFDANTAFVFANAFEMVICIIAAVILIRHVWLLLDGPADLWRRLRKSLRGNFQGGAYDLAIAMMVIFVGKAIRTEAAWAWRMFGEKLSITQLFLGVAISSLGVVCLIRILAPNQWFRPIWIGSVVLAIAFATFSARF